MGKRLIGTVSVFAKESGGGDSLEVVNNLSTVIFDLIHEIGMILLGFGIIQIGLSLQSHDPSQRNSEHDCGRGMLLWI